jgi:FdhD protein
MALEVIDEEPLAIRVQGHPYAVVMRTPGDDLAHAAGFCLTEGLVDDLDEIVNLGSCDDGNTNVVTVTLTPARRALIGRQLDRRGYISQTSCGICGKTLVDELIQELQPIAEEITLPLELAEKCLRNLEMYQPLHMRSAAAHAAVLFDAQFNPLVAMEDVGRHNALDKAIGRLFVERRLHQAKIAAISSRLSYELVQKAVRARIPILMALSRPTSLALTLAHKLNISVVGATKTTGLMLFTHPGRLTE